ncbi:hypothetical protein DFR50_121108 [Roseiarcus fermentans]|uniref:Uncharacterized protein n=1 Tax=Roseiarcus fermentans TaxID=1473586 RepID=A0A366F533_9HYPH|nr:hypothetical protein DFR50_121108 [Roseiarcus fermentans]
MRRTSARPLDRHVASLLAMTRHVASLIASGQANMPRSRVERTNIEHAAPAGKQLSPSKAERSSRIAEREGARRALAPATIAHTASSIRIGVWSDALSLARTLLSISTETSRSAACGDSSRWSMRMPLFFCQAPA